MVFLPPSNGASPWRAAELALDCGEVAPDVLAGDLAVTELEDVQQPEAHPAAAAVAEERPSIDHVAVPDCLVHDEVVAVEPAHRGDALAAQVTEQRLVHAADAGAVVQGADGRGDDLVLGILGEAVEHAL